MTDRDFKLHDILSKINALLEVQANIQDKINELMLEKRELENQELEQEEQEHSELDETTMSEQEGED